MDARNHNRLEERASRKEFRAAIPIAQTAESKQGTSDGALDDYLDRTSSGSSITGSWLWNSATVEEKVKTDKLRVDKLLYVLNTKRRLAGEAPGGQGPPGPSSFAEIEHEAGEQLPDCRYLGLPRHGRNPSHMSFSSHAPKQEKQEKTGRINIRKAREKSKKKAIEADSPHDYLRFKSAPEDIKQQRLTAHILQKPYKDIAESYELLEELGAGVSSVVRRCRHWDTSVEYACKSIDKSKFFSSEDLEALQTEVWAMRTVADHAAVVKLVDIYEDEQNVHLVMDLCKGGELFDRISMLKRFGEREAARLIRILVSVVSHCHSKGIMHRDLKPENILLVSKTSNTNIQVADFGSAKPFVDGVMHSHVVGTAYYIAPEVLEGCYGPQADLWSVGIILYILLCGVPPFPGDSREDIFHLIRTREAAFEEQAWAQVSSPAMDLVRRLLTKDPQRRITAEEVKEHPWILAHVSRTPLPVAMPLEPAMASDQSEEDMYTAPGLFVSQAAEPVDADLFDEMESMPTVLPVVPTMFPIFLSSEFPNPALPPVGQVYEPALLASTSKDPTEAPHRRREPRRLPGCVTWDNENLIQGEPRRSVPWVKSIPDFSSIIQSPEVPVSRPCRVPQSERKAAVGGGSRISSRQRAKSFEAASEAKERRNIVLARVLGVSQGLPPSPMRAVLQSRSVSFQETTTEFGHGALLPLPSKLRGVSHEHKPSFNTILRRRRHRSTGDSWFSSFDEEPPPTKLEEQDRWNSKPSHHSAPVGKLLASASAPGPGPALAPGPAPAKYVVPPRLLQVLQNKPKPGEDQVVVRRNS